MSSKKFTTFQTKVLPVVEFTIEGAGENGAAREFKLVIDFNAIAKIESELGRTLKTVRDWRVKSDDFPQGLTGADITYICWAAFDRFHPEVTLREVRQWLGPTDVDVLWLILLEMCFPGIAEAAEEAAKLKAEAAAAAPAGGGPGEQQPTNA